MFHYDMWVLQLTLHVREICSIGELDELGDCIPGDPQETGSATAEGAEGDVIRPPQAGDVA